MLRNPRDRVLFRKKHKDNTVSSRSEMFVKQFNYLDTEDFVRNKWFRFCNCGLQKRTDSRENGKIFNNGKPHQAAIPRKIQPFPIFV